LERFNAPGAGIAFAIAQLGPKRDVAAKTVERQLTVVAVIAVKIGSCLLAVQGIKR
jgi:hypothetical protein